MLSMTVTEIPRRLEPVTRDTFMEPAEPSEVRDAAPSHRPASERPA
jgi:hypothetical protein